MPADLALSNAMRRKSERRKGEVGLPVDQEPHFSEGASPASV